MSQILAVDPARQASLFHAPEWPRAPGSVPTVWYCRLKSTSYPVDPPDRCAQPGPGTVPEGPARRGTAAYCFTTSSKGTLEDRTKEDMEVLTDETRAPGPIDFILLEFPDQEPTGLVAAELMRLVDDGIIAIYDIIAVRKDVSGMISGFEVADLGDGDISFAAFAGARSGLLGDDDLSNAGEIMEPGTIAVMLMYENTWASGVVGAVVATGGQVAASARIPAEDVIAALEALESLTGEEN